MQIATQRSRRHRRGMTLIEIAFAMPIIMVALGMFIQMLGAGTSLRQNSREHWLASLRAQDVLESIRNVPFEDFVALYNEDPFDDPLGPGTAPGCHFNIPELAPLASDDDGFVGRIHLPVVNVGTEIAPDWQLREDASNQRLSMPRDLSGDNVIDDQNHMEDYTIVPVLVEVEWRSRFGTRRVQVQTLFTEF